MAVCHWLRQCFGFPSALRGVRPPCATGSASAFCGSLVVFLPPSAVRPPPCFPPSALPHVAGDSCRATADSIRHRPCDALTAHGVCGVHRAPRCRGFLPCHGCLSRATRGDGTNDARRSRGPLCAQPSKEFPGISRSAEDRKKLLIPLNVPGPFKRPQRLQRPPSWRTPGSIRCRGIVARFPWRCGRSCRCRRRGRALGRPGCCTRV